MSQKVIIMVDSREAAQARKVIETIRGLGGEVNVDRLDAGDYVISEGFAVERKTVTDFVSTLTRRDLFGQIFTVKQVYAPIMVLEGYLPVAFKISKISPMAVWGALFALAKSGIAVVPTLNQRDTGMFLYAAAKAEQMGAKSAPRLHPLKRAKGLREEQVYFISSLPKIGPDRATRILERYETPMNAFLNVEMWAEDVDSVGPKTVEHCKKVLHSTYNTPVTSQAGGGSET